MCEDAVDGDVIGGPGVIVEIDETHMVTAKHHSGRNLVRQQSWIFGRMERDSKKKFEISLGLGGRRTRCHKFSMR